MSVSNRKRDKDKDGKGAGGGEPSANYMIGTSSRGGRTSDTRKGEEEEEMIATSTAPNRATSNQERTTTQKEKTPTTTSEVPRDETPAAIVTTPTTNSKTVTEAHNMYHLKEQQQQSFTKALDETRDNIRKSIDEARNQIPHYTQATNEYQEQTIQATREIADNFLESQKEIINSFQSAWLPQIDAVNRVFTSTWVSPRYYTQIYANIISNFANNIIAATRLANNTIFTNMEAFRTMMEQTRDNAKEISRIAVNVARSLEQTVRDDNTTAIPHTTSSYSSPSSSSSRLYGSTGRYSFDEDEGQQQQIPSRQNKSDTQRMLAFGQALKDLRFPTDKNRILQFVQEQYNTNQDYEKIVPLLYKIEDRQYQNVSDVTKAIGIVE